MEEVEKKLLNREQFELLISYLIFELENSDFLERSKLKNAQCTWYLNRAANKCIPKDISLLFEPSLVTVKKGESFEIELIEEYNLETILNRFKSYHIRDSKDINHFRRGLGTILESMVFYTRKHMMPKPIKKGGGPSLELYKYS